MQIRKTYKGVNPELLYAEVKDFVLKQGVDLREDKLETYAAPNDTSSFISRGTLTFKTQGGTGATGKECVRVHLVGSAKTETKIMLDIDEKCLSEEKISSLQEDIDFIFGIYEVKETS